MDRTVRPWLPPVGDAVSNLRFWLRIMKEHSLFIALGLPPNQAALIFEANSFMQLFEALENRALAPGFAVSMPFIQETMLAVARLIEFKRGLIRMAVRCSLGGSLYPSLLDHITREAMHFFRLLEMLQCPSQPISPVNAILAVEAFWLRLMKEHTEFIAGLLDPSERGLLAKAEGFRSTFVALMQTANELSSMAESCPASFRTVQRFTEDVVTNTTMLRDFKAAGTELLLQCKVLSVISTPVLGDHIRREADRFLAEIAAIQPGLDAI